MNNQEFFERVKPWSKRKHRLLGKYLPPFSAKVATTSNRREIFCVDAFAGAALYDDGEEGSPLLTARFSDVCASWQNPVALRMINIEPDRRNEGTFKQLELATEAWTRKGLVDNFNDDFQQALPKIIRIIGNAPALFFIDPFGPSALKFRDLEPILNRSQKITELIINFDTDGLRRIVDAALSDKINPKTATTNIRLVGEILGQNDWRQNLIGEGMTTIEREDSLLAHYLSKFERFGYLAVAYPVR